MDPTQLHSVSTDRLGQLHVQCVLIKGNQGFGMSCSVTTIRVINIFSILCLKAHLVLFHYFDNSKTMLSSCMTDYGQSEWAMSQLAVLDEGSVVLCIFSG